MIFVRLSSILMPFLAAAAFASAAWGGVDVGGKASGKMTEGDATAQDNEWVAYRDVYMQMIRFEKYGRPKHLIQQHYQVSPKSRTASFEGVTLTLMGQSVGLNLTLDATGRTVFPFLKSAYDENARLLLNRKANLYELHPRISIVPRQDGIYEMSDLRMACEQALSYLKYVGTSSFAARECVGVRFAYSPGDAEAGIRVVAGDVQTPVLAEAGSAFPDEVYAAFKVSTLRFSDWPDKARVVTRSMPVAVAPVFK